MDLTLLLLLYFPQVFNLEDLDPTNKTLWFHFALEKENHYQSYNLDLFKQEKIFICWMMKQDKLTTSQVNTPWNF